MRETSERRYEWDDPVPKSTVGCGFCEMAQRHMERVHGVVTRTRHHHEYLLEALRDPAEALSYLRAASADSPELFCRALEDVLEAQRRLIH